MTHGRSDARHQCRRRAAAAGQARRRPTCCWTAGRTARSMLRSPHPLERLSRQAHAASGALGQGRARPRVPRAAHRRTAPGASSPTRRRSPRCAASRRRCWSASCRRTADRDPVRQRPRTRAAGARRHDVGMPYAPISVPYSLMSSDFGKLKSIIEMLTPGLVFAADGKAVRRAIEAAVPRGVEIVVTANPPATGRPRYSPNCWRPADRRGRCRARQGRARHHRQDPVHLGIDRLAQGRHQHPAHAVLEPGDDPRDLPFIAEEPPVLVDWLPWNHTFGGNHNFGMVLVQRRLVLHRRGQAAARRDRSDRAQPARDRADHLSQRAEGLRDAAAAICAADAALRQNFFSRLKVLFYAGAGLQQHVWDELQADGASRPPASASSSCRASARPRPRRRRSPAPGNPSGRATSACRCAASSSSSCRPAASSKRRLKGPNITPGYWRRPDLTKEAFDDEGYLQDRRRAEVRRPGRSRQGPDVRRPAGRGLQARQRHLGQRRRVARAIRRSLRAAGARRGDRRRRPRRHRGAGVSRRRGLPQARGPCRRRAGRGGAGAMPRCATSSGSGSTRWRGRAPAARPASAA